MVNILTSCYLQMERVPIVRNSRGHQDRHFEVSDVMLLTIMALLVVKWLVVPACMAWFHVHALLMHIWVLCLPAAGGLCCSSATAHLPQQKMVQGGRVWYWLDKVEGSAQGLHLWLLVDDDNQSNCCSSVLPKLFSYQLLGTVASQQTAAAWLLTRCNR